MHSLMGKWIPGEVSFQELISAENINPDNLKRIQSLVPLTYEKIKEKL